jgi:hypothetical protein
LLLYCSFLICLLSPSLAPALQEVRVDEHEEGKGKVVEVWQV